MKQLRRGILVALEGIDGCGKSTLTKKLKDALDSYHVTISREPGSTEVGASIRHVLMNDVKKSPKTEFLLFAADRAEHIQQVVRPALASHNIVISDRMATSSLAYQGYGKGVSLDHINYVNNWALDECEPDIIIYLAVDPVTAYNRIVARSEEVTSFEREKYDFFERVVDGFEVMAESREHVKKIDATQAVDAVAEQALQAVLEVVEQYEQ